MKQLILSFAVFCLSLGASAQLPVYPLYNNVDGYTLPRTVIEVEVVQQREVIIRGPYARYASQYLGVSGAPMLDKESYKILSAQISWRAEADIQASYGLSATNPVSSSIFDWLNPSQKREDAPPTDAEFAGADIQGRTPFKDVGTNTKLSTGSKLSAGRNSAVEKSEAQMASDAAQVIFKIRARRLELICGDQGEYVFGEGLGAALEEMDRIEEEYTALFLGKRYTQTTVRNFEVTPDKGANRIVAFRFTSSGGVVSADDLAANPVNLEFQTVETPAAGEIDYKSKPKVVPYRIPVIDEVKLWDGVTIYDTARVPIFQKGKVVDVPIITL